MIIRARSTQRYDNSHLHEINLLYEVEAGVEVGVFGQCLRIISSPHYPFASHDTLLQQHHSRLKWRASVGDSVVHALAAQALHHEDDLRNSSTHAVLPLANLCRRRKRRPSRVSRPEASRAWREAVPTGQFCNKKKLAKAISATSHSIDDIFGALS